MAAELVIHTHSYRGPGVFHTKYRHLKSHHHPSDMKREPLRHSSPCLNSHSIPHSIQKLRPLTSAFQHHTTIMPPPSTFKVALFSVEKGGENSPVKAVHFMRKDNFNYKSQTTHSTFLFAVLCRSTKCIKPCNTSGDRSSENQVNKNGRQGPRVRIRLMSENLPCG